MTPDVHYRNGFKWMATILGGLVVFSAVIVQLDLDRRVAGLFFSETNGWYLANNQPWLFLSQYGTIPGIALSILALMGYFVCQIKEHYRPLRNYFLLIVLTSVLGAGLLVNAVLKPYWGRPRPIQTVEFGGVLEYRPMYAPGEPGRGRSFTAGHSTMGFLFVTLIFFYRKSRTVAYGGLAFGLIAGGLLSAARILQGAHYLSDNIWSLGIILLTATGLYYFALRIPLSRLKPSLPLSNPKKILLGCFVAVLIAAMFFCFLTRRPYYNLYQRRFAVNSRLTQINVWINTPLEKKTVRFKDIDRGRMFLHSHGFGQPAANRAVQFANRVKGSALNIKAHITQRGFFAELDHQVELWLPKSIEKMAEVHVVSVPTGDQ